MFLWCEEWKSAVNSLTLFKEQDIEFHKKLGCVSGNYDNQHKIAQKEKIVIQSKDIATYMNFKCLSVQELWNKKLERLNSYVVKTCKLPTQKDKDLKIKQIGQWVSTQKINYATSLWIMKEPVIRQEWEEFKRKHILLFLSNEEIWMNTLVVVVVAQVLLEGMVLHI